MDKLNIREKVVAAMVAILKGEDKEDHRPSGFREDEDCSPDSVNSMDASYLDPDEFEELLKGCGAVIKEVKVKNERYETDG